MNTFKDFCSNKIKVESPFLKNIEYKTEVWKSKRKIKYCSLFCTNNSIIAIMFDNKGLSIKKSFLYIDEELEILDTLQDLKEQNIKYKIFKKEYSCLKTRNENYKDKFIKNSLKSLNAEKINYIYFECFGKHNSDSTKLNELININCNNDKYKNLYNILKLISSIKK